MAIVVVGLGVVALSMLTSRRERSANVEAQAPVEEPAAAAQDKPGGPGSAPAAAAAIEGPDLRLTIDVSALCWLSATADGERVFYRLAQPGEKVQIDAASGITLRVGDPAAIAYTINGVRGRPLGGAGQPVTVRITQDDYKRLLAIGEGVPGGANPTPRSI